MKEKVAFLLFLIITAFISATAVHKVDPRSRWLRIPDKLQREECIAYCSQSKLKNPLCVIQYGKYEVYSKATYDCYKRECPTVLKDAVTRDMKECEQLLKQKVPNSAWEGPRSKMQHLFVRGS
ncbi:uncharacterized protein LOC117176515 [Belonocnema kinseyi]|uniref:uncharacterized protein LOC117176515 n=1 Tax=Belonocnema kinseyi TaxID=2817044 RepID=UPI00143D86C3|nr:uncharacterized protein LOC117176515 [Belonocnema kinseyi]